MLINQFRIYCDGSCNNRLPFNERKGGWAFVVLDKNEDIIAQCSGYVAENTTSQRMEMQAALESLQWVHREIISRENRKVYELTIFSDSSYLVNCFRNKWYVKWLEYDLVGIKNKDLWLKLLLFSINTFSIKTIYQHVKGHNGDQWNEYVDKLAGDARLNKIVTNL